MATKFDSTLTGAQIDTALRDMNNHISEAWAVGQRNGSDVIAGDVTYNNNSKYYSDRSAHYADIASRANIPTGDPAVRYDLEQQLTESEKLQARTNIGAKYSNVNWLNNPFFTINQRGATTYSAAGYTLDRWYMVENDATVNGVNVTKTSDGVRLQKTSPAGSAAGRLCQRVHDFEYLRGGDVTLSITYKSNISFLIGWATAASGTYTKSTTCPASSNWRTVSLTGALTTTISPLWVDIAILNATAAGNVDIKCVKLERGNVSTIDSDDVPNYADEFRRCQFFYARYSGTYNYVGTGIIGSATQVRIQVPKPIMRANAVVAISGTIYISTKGHFGSAGYLMTSISDYVAKATHPTAWIYGNVPLGGMTTGDVIEGQFRDETSYLEIRADY